MAVAVKSGQVIEASSGAASTTVALTLPGAPTSGNLLVFAMGGDKNTGALTLSGFTQLYSTLGASTSLYIWYKISAGTETTINPSWATSSASGNMAYYMELEDTAVSGSDWVVSGQASTTYSDTATNSRSSNTTGTLTDAGLALACFSIDSSQSWTSGTAYTNSYASQYAGTGGGGRGAIFVGKLNVSAGGTTETTFSYTGTADQVAGAIGVFAKVAVGATGTKVYLSSTVSDISPGSDDERLASLSSGPSEEASNVATVAGPTDGVQATNASSVPLTWFTKPLKSVSLTGTITINVWMNEGAAAANVGAHVEIAWYDNLGTTKRADMVTGGIGGEKGTELPTSYTVQNWNVTPGAASVKNGDRLKITVFGNDAGGNMASANVFGLAFGNPNADAEGDSWVQFSHTIEEYNYVHRDQQMPSLIAQ